VHVRTRREFTNETKWAQPNKETGPPISERERKRGGQGVGKKPDMGQISLASLLRPNLEVASLKKKKNGKKKKKKPPPPRHTHKKPKPPPTMKQKKLKPHAQRNLQRNSCIVLYGILKCSDRQERTKIQRTTPYTRQSAVPHRRGKGSKKSMMENGHSS